MKQSEVREKLLYKIKKTRQGIKILSIPLIVSAVIYVVTKNEYWMAPIIVFGLIATVLGGMKIAYEDVVKLDRLRRRNKNE